MLKFSDINILSSNAEHATLFTWRYKSSRDGVAVNVEQSPQVLVGWKMAQQYTFVFFVHKIVQLACVIKTYFII